MLKKVASKCTAVKSINIIRYIVTIVSIIAFIVGSIIVLNRILDKFIVTMRYSTQGDLQGSEEYHDTVFVLQKMINEQSKENKKVTALKSIYWVCKRENGAHNKDDLDVNIYYRIVYYDENVEETEAFFHYHKFISSSNNLESYTECVPINKIKYTEKRFLCVKEEDLTLREKTYSEFAISVISNMVIGGK